MGSPKGSCINVGHHHRRSEGAHAASLNYAALLEDAIDSGYLERRNEVYSEFFLYYDDAPLLIVNANEIDLANSAADYQDLVDYLLDIRSGRHYFNPTFFR